MCCDYVIEKELAIATGGSDRKLQWKKAREAVIPPKQPRASVNQRNISIMSSLTTLHVSSPVGNSCIYSCTYSRNFTHSTSDDFSCFFSHFSYTSIDRNSSQTNSIEFISKLRQCLLWQVAARLMTCNRGKIWSSRVDITYLKKAGPKLSTWKLGSGKPYKDSIHKNSVFHCLGKVDQ
ncbi:unnamed protein product [Mytilus edulis]|uniref:Uncharacterized protein n=1 Tax=Mytilus edulis TaxID=6550 RepID=A0A8S3VAE4_MYTED|nr:unnamed protein product [Mytilus edulis]